MEGEASGRQAAAVHLRSARLALVHSEGSLPPSQDSGRVSGRIVSLAQSWKTA